MFSRGRNNGNFPQYELESPIDLKYNLDKCLECEYIDDTGSGDGGEIFLSRG